MKKEELNEYIKHYLEKDKTQSAIMLTGEWGAGKSYYIKNYLEPYIKEGKRECVIVSLYGIKDLKDISKAIYVELRSIKLIKSTEKTEMIRIGGKTILKNFVNIVLKVNIDGTIEEKDLEALYKSLDLSKKLIVFEDIERSQVDIIEFLGYVNNFVEQDGVKVLLVANEKEIFELGSGEKYKMIKEKTVNDTLIFEADLEESLSNMIKNYENLKSILIMQSENQNTLVDIIKNTNLNLRSFNFACQKTSDILEKSTDFEDELVKTIFFSIVMFSMKYKESNTRKNYEQKYPLLDSCKKFLDNHTIDKKSITKLKEDFESYKKQQEALKANEEINKLKVYYVRTEEEVLQTIKNIEKGLMENNIEISIYGGLAKLIIEVSEIIGYDTGKIEKYLVENLKNRESEVNADVLFIGGYNHSDVNLSKKYLDLKEKMVESLNSSQKVNWNSFEYNPTSISSFYKNIINKNVEIELRETLSRDLDIQRLVEMLEKCTAAQIEDMRGVFFAIYRTNSEIKYTEKNNDFLNSLYEEVEKLKEMENFDKIIKLQLQYFLDNLKIFTREIKYVH